jgi:hypothetical protein
VQQSSRQSNEDNENLSPVVKVPVHKKLKPIHVKYIRQPGESKADYDRNRAKARRKIIQKKQDWKLHTNLLAKQRMQNMRMKE